MLAWTLCWIGPSRTWSGWFSNELCTGEAASDLAEDVRDLRTQQRQDGNDHNRHEDEDQCVLDQTLAFFAR